MCEADAFLPFHSRNERPSTIRKIGDGDGNVGGCYQLLYIINMFRDEVCSEGYS